MVSRFSLGRAALAGSLVALFALAPTQGALITVTNTNENLAGSLRQAIQDANPAGGDTIVFQIPTTDPGYSASNNTWTIALTSGQLSISSSVTIDSGGSKIIVMRSNAGGTPNFRVFFINTYPNIVTLIGLTIANGHAGSPDDTGGGIRHHSGTLVIRNCTFTGNYARLGGGGIYNNIFETLQVSNSTFTDNGQESFGAVTPSGGGLENGGTATIENCTFQGNIANQGAAIYTEGTGSTLTLSSTTISGNMAMMANEAAVWNDIGSAHVRNTIIAANTSAGGGNPDVRGPFLSDGYNFIGVQDANASGFGNPGSHDQVGSIPSPANPQLGVLQDNGGVTQTMAPAVGSFVIDQGSSGGLGSDQRGQPRPVDQPGVINAGGGDDIGAVENGLTQSGPTYTVTTTLGHFDSNCSSDDCTLREAISASNAAPDANTINFAPGVHGVINSLGVAFPIVTPITINGPGARVLQIDGLLADRIFNITNAGNVTISGLRLVRGVATPLNGGGILHSGAGTLTLVDCSIELNSANNGLGGGGVFNDSGSTLVATGCAFLGNATNRAGGAVYNLGALSATNCTFSDNVALNGGAIISKANGGASSMTLRNCTITNCTATDAATGGGSGGGGVYAEGANAQVHFGNTIIAGNASSGVNPDLRGNVTSDGHNLIGRIGFAGIITAAGDLIGSGTGIDPGFASVLQDNGGPTNTRALASTSPAVNAGDDALAPQLDQRGYTRIGVSDMGAFEFGGEPLSLIVTSVTQPDSSHILLQGIGLPNALHTVQVSLDPNPNNFEFLGSTMANGSGQWQYNVTPAMGQTRLFYRITFP